MSEAEASHAMKKPRPSHLKPVGGCAGDERPVSVAAVRAYRIEAQMAKKDAEQWAQKARRFEMLLADVTTTWPKSRHDLLRGAGLDRVGELHDIDFGMLRARVLRFVESDKIE